MDRAQVRDTTLAYELTGAGGSAGAEGSGLLPLVWGHGLSSNRAAEDDFGLLDFTRVAATTRLLRYDARGHGESEYTPEPTAYSWLELARDQLALTDGLGLSRYVAAGASMGCGTALHAALLAPERIAGLVLVIPPTAWETRAERVEIWGQVADLIDRSDIDGFIAGMAAMPTPDPLAGRTEWDEMSARNARRTDPSRLAGLFRGAAHADLPPRDQIRTITAPALILAWTGDPGHPASTAEALAELLPQAELALASTWDELTTWTDRTIAFLRGLDGRTDAGA